MNNNDYIKQEVIDVEVESSVAPTEKKSVLSTEMKLISCLVPVVGLVLYLINKDEDPAMAKEELKWACVGVAIGIGISALTKISFYAIF